MEMSTLEKAEEPLEFVDLHVIRVITATQDELYRCSRFRAGLDAVHAPDHRFAGVNMECFLRPKARQDGTQSLRTVQRLNEFQSTGRFWIEHMNVCEVR